jgi:acetate kinase
VSQHAVLAVNSGSSSLKASLLQGDGTRRNFRYPHLGYDRGAQAQALAHLLEELQGVEISAVAHRIVHGGDAAEPARFIDAAERTRLEGLISFAPLHMPNNLAVVDFLAQHLGDRQFACYDTAFHRSMPDLARRLPLPTELGVERYGFHGINYSHIANVLPDLLPDAADRRIVVAHLGSGASVCLLRGLRSVDTTMGLTPLGGIAMGTRPGDMDPGVVLMLAEKHSGAQLTDLFYHRAGLHALSDGLSSDMATLLASKSAEAKFAVDYFCAGVRGAIGTFAAKAGGVDGLVFTGGIGENAPAIRAAICEPLGFLGLILDTEANPANQTRLHKDNSCPILRVAADEEAMMVSDVRALLRRLA